MATPPPRCGGRACPARGGVGHSGESGYALMLVFLMAALVAIGLYRELPRVAMQSQRHKEQLLMERGEQYRRAIQVYYATTRRYPQSIDDLETTQMRHFVRHKYVDPMTGKSDWRIIHIQGGVLVDSVITKQSTDQQQQAFGERGVTAFSSLGDQAAGGLQVRPQDRRRASDASSAPGSASSGLTGPGTSPGDGANPDGQQLAGAQPQSGMPGYPMQGSPGMPPGMPGVPGMPPGMPGMPGAQGGQPAGQGGGSATPFPGISGTYTGQPSPAYPGQPNPNMPGGQPGMPGAPGGAPNAATQMISDLLTRPNPAGYNAVQQLQQQSAGGAPGMNAPGVPMVTGAGQGGGANGVAGIASTAEVEGVMVYNDRTAYNEWEFIFDPSKVPAIAPPSGGSMGGGPAGRPGSQPGQTNRPAGSPAGAMTPTAVFMGSGGGAPGSGGMGSGAAGMQMMGQPGGATGMQGMGQANGAAGMQTGGMGMGSTGMPPNYRPGRP